ncbi:pyridoxal phosphate phosphatase PHOSPHO2 [Drosophila tropicalis]|uniref:pyridoxal phosphate phosphatase PHOSPHO2 n=1 Tax=Drosophila tropicalis TaxID=46794 RepID=UPI0035AC0A34
MLRDFLLKMARSALGQRRSMCSISNGGAKGREMAAFDFDLTIVDRDSDTSVGQLLPSTERTAELFDLIPKCGWVAFIQHALQLLHQKYSMDAVAVGRHIRSLPPVPGILRLLRQLAGHHSNMDLFIVSDSNCFFISEWLEAHGVDHLFAGIYTNPASIAADGRLIVSPYEEQNHCELCPVNLCKGRILDKVISMGNYKRVLYIGDGCNDLCAVQRLRANDIACIRRGYELHRKLTNAHHRPQLTCNHIFFWSNGHDLYEQLPK